MADGLPPSGHAPCRPSSRHGAAVVVPGVAGPTAPQTTLTVAGCGGLLSSGAAADVLSEDVLTNFSDGAPLLVATAAVTGPDDTVGACTTSSPAPVVLHHAQGDSFRGPDDSVRGLAPISPLLDVAGDGDAWASEATARDVAGDGDAWASETTAHSREKEVVREMPCGSRSNVVGWVENAARTDPCGSLLGYQEWNSSVPEVGDVLRGRLGPRSPFDGLGNALHAENSDELPCADEREPSYAPNLR